MLCPGDDRLIHGKARNGGMGVQPRLLGDNAGGPAEVFHHGVVCVGSHDDIPVPEGGFQLVKAFAHAQAGGNRFFRNAGAG